MTKRSIIDEETRLGTWKEIVEVKKDGSRKELVDGNKRYKPINKTTRRHGKRRKKAMVKRRKV